MQEALANVCKHANARRARLTLERKGAGYEIVIEDDGIGMTVDPGGERGESGHYGIAIMRERALPSRRRADPGQRPGGGTRVRLYFPPWNRRARADCERRRRNVPGSDGQAWIVSEPISVVLIDDHGLCRRGLAELLEQRAGIKVLGTTGNADEAVRLLRDGQPDLVIMDLRMAPVDGFTLLARVRAEGIDTPVVVLTMSDLKDDLARAFRAGVRGYLLKDMDPDDVIDAIRRIARGEIVVAPLMAAKLVDLLVPGKEGKTRDDYLRQLTGREREILQHLSSGKSNKAIAQVLDISHDTVKLHVRHILSKLGLTSRVEAAVFAVEHRVSMEAGGRRRVDARLRRTLSRGQAPACCRLRAKDGLLRRLFRALRREPVELLAQPHDVADDDQRRGVELRLGDARRQRRERSGHDALRRRGPLLDDRGAGVAREAVLDELAADRRQAQEPHVDDDRLPRPRQRGPVEIHAAVLAGAPSRTRTTARGRDA